MARLSNAQAQAEVEAMREATQLRDQAAARDRNALAKLKLSAKIIHQHVDKKAKGK
jgi:hypothetical protein